MVGSKLMNMNDDSIPDMTEISYEHVASLSFRADLPSPLNSIAIGWLGSSVPDVGHVPDSLLDALRTASVAYETDTGALGYHQCQICMGHEDRGEFVIEADGRTYVLPRMVIHYIDAHRYKLPQQFLNDLQQWNEKS